MGHEDTPRCGAFGLPDGSVCWRVWAPRARTVELVLIDGSQQRSCPMTAESRGYFSHTEPNIAEGQRYAYRLDNGPERPDPVALWQPDGIHRPSAVLFPERFTWSEGSSTGLKREELVFYELHVGTFTPQGTFDAVIPRLDALRQLGVTAIELMPVAQFPGARNWGYDGVHLYAPQNTYGGPHGLQRLVNACHERGLAIFLDVVYNHTGPEGNYLSEFGPYFSERYHTSWGPSFNFDDAGSDPVRAYVLDNVRTWIGSYRMDGLRLDATHAIYDTSPRHILREIKETADEAAAGPGRSVFIIAEHLRNDVRILQPPERGGYGLDGEWNDDFHHAVHAYLTGERKGYYMDFGRAQDFPKVIENTYVLDGVYSEYRGRRFGTSAAGLSGDRFVVSIQTHDQVGNRARGDRLATLLDPPALRLAASLLLFAPHLPLLFMGEEYGEQVPFPFFCSFLDPRLVDNVRKGRRRDYAPFMGEIEMPDPGSPETFARSILTWSWPEGSWQNGLRRLYQDLLAARRSWPALRDFTHRAARLLPNDSQPFLLEVVRGVAGQQPDTAMILYFNLTGQSQSLPEGMNRGKTWLFSSEAAQYGGQRAGEALQELAPYECVAFGPVLGERLL